MKLNYTFMHLQVYGMLVTQVYINGRLEATLYPGEKYPAPRAQKRLEREARQTIKPLAA